MYSYSIPFSLIDNFPAELAIPALRQYIFVKWFRIRGGVYTYIEKILEQFRGKIILNVIVKNVTRIAEGITLEIPEGQQVFDKVVFATPPDQVLKLLADPTPAETKRFSRWQPNQVQTILHTDTSMYDRYGIAQPSEFDFFKAEQDWGYNASLNQLCDIQSDQCYSLAFNLASLIAKNKIIHRQDHHTPLYTADSFHYRDQIVDTNGENNTYHAGAYLGDGLHEGAITAAMQIAQLIQSPRSVKLSQQQKASLMAH